MSIEEICINQFMRPKMYFQKDGVGDCTKCEPNPDNKYCLQYYPIHIQQIEVKENGKEYNSN